MKKIFILPMLIMPIVAHATDPVGPAHVNSGAVVATANAPYAIATPETGDTTNVVSASYVKGAYNDTIAAINKLDAKASDLNDIINEVDHIKQNRLQVDGTEYYIDDDVLNDGFVGGLEDALFEGQISSQNDNKLATVNAILNGFLAAFDIKRVNAVTTWGDDSHPTQLTLTNVQ